MADTPELLRARAGGQLQSDVRNGVGGLGGNGPVNKTFAMQALGQEFRSPQPLKHPDKCTALTACNPSARQAETRVPGTSWGGGRARIRELRIG